MPMVASHDQSTAAQRPALIEVDSSDHELGATDDSDNKGTSHERNRQLQEHFANGMRGIATMKSHRRVAVLLLSWKLEGKGYMDVAPEIKALRKVFEEVYSFSVRERQLETGYENRAGPAADLNFYLAEFVREESKDDCLLIVYYAGHGVRNVRHKDLVLLGGNPKSWDYQKDLTQAVWSRAEHQLHEVKADKLLIFDCCYAGVLARETRSFSRHIFEFIGSTRHNSTAVGPGDDSFTRALIWALEELAGLEEGFTTMTLMKKIENAPYFKDRDQVPVNSERGKKQSLYKLRLAPLPSKMTGGMHQRAESTSEEQETPSPIRSYLHLTVLFSKYPQKRDISSLTRSLCGLAKDIPVKQVLWKGLADEDLKLSSAQEAATKVLTAWHRRKSSAKKYDLDRISPLQAEGLSGKHLMVSTDHQVANHSDFSQDTAVESPLPMTIPKVIVAQMEVQSKTVEDDVPSQHLLATWQQSLPTLMLVFLAGVAAAHSRQLFRRWRQGR